VTKTMPTSLRLEPELKESLQALADAEKRPLSTLMSDVLSEYARGRMVAVDLPEDVAEGLDAMAVQLDRPKGWIVAKAVAKFVRDRAMPPTG